MPGILINAVIKCGLCGREFFAIPRNEKELMQLRRKNSVPDDVELVPTCSKCNNLPNRVLRAALEKRNPSGRVEPDAP